MTIAPLADVIGAVVARLRSFNEIADFVTTNSGYTADATAGQKARPRISAELQPYWQLGSWPAPPTGPKGSYALLISGPIGGPGADRDGAIQSTRIDTHWYGPNPFEAMRFWRQGHPCLCPTVHQGRADSFIAAGCGVYTVDLEGGPIRLVEPDTHYPKIVASYILRWSEVSRP